jgi:ATP sulfurylase
MVIRMNAKKEKENHVNPLPFTGEIRIMSVKEAKAWAREDCATCQENLKMAKKLGWRCVVNTTTRDVVAIMP